MSRYFEARIRRDNCFIEIPVYGSNRDMYEQQALERLEQYKELLLKDGYKKSSNSYKNAVQFAEKKYLVPWDFNQVTGWLCLYVDGRDKVKAHYFKADGKIFSHNSFRKVFRWQTWKEIEVWMDEKWTSSQIFDALRKALTDLNDTEPFKRYYIDLETLYAIGPYVNWKRLVFPE